MDFMQRGSHQPGTDGVSSPAATTSGGHGKNKGRGFSWLRLGSILFLFGVTVLLVAIIISFATSGQKAESKYVKNNGLQAVFLNGGQVYFGKITTLNDKFIR